MLKPTVPSVDSLEKTTPSTAQVRSGLTVYGGAETFKIALQKKELSCTDENIRIFLSECADQALETVFATLKELSDEKKTPLLAMHFSNVKINPSPVIPLIEIFYQQELGKIFRHPIVWGHPILLKKQERESQKMRYINISLKGKETSQPTLSHANHHVISGLFDETLQRIFHEKEFTYSVNVNDKLYNGG
jgi:hypothetical protein